MASIQKTEAGTWRVQIERRGRREFKTLPTKALATAWANQREAEIAQGLVASVDVAQRTAFSEVVEHYRNGELKKKRNRGYPPILNTLDKHFGKARLATLYSKDIAQFRDRRLNRDNMAPASVVKELNLLRYLIDYAIREMGIHLPANTARMVKNPPVNNARDRVFADDEERRLFEAFPNENYRDIGSLALETACRLGEMLKLEWNDVDFNKRTAKIRKENSKTGVARTVPLSSKAISVLKGRTRPMGGGRIFDCWARGDSFENGYRRAVQRARERYEDECEESGMEPSPDLLKDLRFHDFRHIATSRLAKVFPNVIELSRVTGHSDLKMLSRYYHVTAEDLAQRMA